MAADAPGAPAQWLRVGVVGRPHGLDGSFHVLDPTPEALSLGARVRVGEHERAIERRAGTDPRPILRLEGCSDRDAAEALRGAELLLARDHAPALEDEEWWAQDLEGCTVRDGAREIGRVARLLALPSCEVLEVAREGEPLLVPLVRDAVRSVDVAGRVIDVDLEFLGEA
jgi:16S rRNA processing protein RimM